MEINPLEVLLAFVLIAVVVTAGFAVVILTKTVTIPGTGTVKAVGVAFFHDSAATIPLSSITWGVVVPGYTYFNETYCKNIQDSNVTLFLYFSNWSSASAQKYLVPGWSYKAGTILQPAQVIAINFTLSVLANVTGVTAFSFNLNVNATG